MFENNHEYASNMWPNKLKYHRQKEGLHMFEKAWLRLLGPTLFSNCRTKELWNIASTCPGHQPSGKADQKPSCAQHNGHRVRGARLLKNKGTAVQGFRPSPQQSPGLWDAFPSPSIPLSFPLKFSWCENSVTYLILLLWEQGKSSSLYSQTLVNIKYSEGCLSILLFFHW